jgi:hypothetical protein
MEKIKITTMTQFFKINSDIDIITAAKYLQLNDKIIGIKFNYGRSFMNILKGVAKKSKPKERKVFFYNQITLIIKLNENKIINCKIFNNGSIQLTGCKHEDDGKEISKILIEEFKRIKGVELIKLKKDDSTGIYTSDDNLVWNINTLQPIGYYDNEILYFGKNKTIKSPIKEFCFEDIEFNKSKKKALFDRNGNKIGEKSINIFPKYKKFFNNRCTFHKSYIFNPYNTIIGELKIIFYDEEINDINVDNNDSSVEIKHSYKIFKNEEENDINASNFQIFLTNGCTCLNRPEISIHKLKNKFKEYEIEYYEDNKIYNGIKILIYFKDNELISGDTIAKIKNGLYDYKFHITIFRKGKISFLGFKNKDQIEKTYNFLNSLLSEPK